MMRAHDEGERGRDLLNRRAFLFKSAAGVAAVATAGAVVGLLPRAAAAMPAKSDALDMAMDMPMSAPTQQQTQKPGENGGVVEMDGDFYKPVRRDPKPNAVVQMTPKQIDNFERGLACPCPCTLDVFTCRTTDFSCGYSPRVHDDVRRLVAGGYSADEIMKAMTDAYGNVILSAPPKTGFNLVGWFAPFVALGVGAVVISTLLRGWRRNAKASAIAGASHSIVRPAEYGASDDEIARLQEALRDDSR